MEGREGWEGADWTEAWAGRDGREHDRVFDGTCPASKIGRGGGEEGVRAQRGVLGAGAPARERARAR